MIWQWQLQWLTWPTTSNSFSLPLLEGVHPSWMAPFFILGLDKSLLLYYIKDTEGRKYD
jgi:hypothetical protein